MAWTFVRQPKGRYLSRQPSLSLAATGAPDGWTEFLTDWVSDQQLGLGGQAMVSSRSVRMCKDGVVDVRADPAVGAGPWMQEQEIAALKNTRQVWEI